MFLLSPEGHTADRGTTDNLIYVWKINVSTLDIVLKH